MGRKGLPLDLLLRLTITAAMLRSSYFVVLIGWLAAANLWATNLQAATTILFNQTPHRIVATLPQEGGGTSSVTINPKESIPLATQGMVSFTYKVDENEYTGALLPNNVYRFFLDGQKRLKLQRVSQGGLAGPETDQDEGVVLKRLPATLRVKIAVDDDEQTRREIWEKKLKKRVEAASQLLEFFCGMRLEVVAVTRWESKDTLRDFNQTLSEFTVNVPPAPAHLVIGFTSQYNVRSDRSRLGGTRGPLRSHILIREHGPRIGEAERLEVLLHELGHYFGAAHSTANFSLMRPILGDGQSNLRSFRLTYDPINLLAMNLVAEQIRRPDFRSVAQIPLPVQRRLLGVYDWLAEVQPDDPVARQMANVLCAGVLTPAVNNNTGRAELPRPESRAQRLAKAEFHLAVQRVIDAVKRKANERKEQSLFGDRLTEAYLRTAAAAAGTVKRKHAVRAFYYGLAIALDRGSLIHRYPIVAERLRVEVDLAQQAERERLVGSPTLWNRASLFQDFLAAGLLTIVTNSDTAEEITMLDELGDVNDTTGFSFAAVVASRAGIRLSKGLKSGEITLARLSREFSVPKFVPPIKDFLAFWTEAKLEEEYGGIKGEDFQNEINKIDAAVENLPPYRSLR